jgi:dipeptidyl aminopeptidase/acylaminoacyl peptidase
MTLAALTFRPVEFAVGVDIFGISNWHRTANNIPPGWGSQKDALEHEMGDFDDDEFFRAKSPIFHADQIVRPLMVLQGANDPRVLQVESDEIVDAVRANGVPVEYVLFPDEGHGFRKKDNQLEGYRKIREFLDLHLRELPGSRQVPGGADGS